MKSSHKPLRETSFYILASIAKRPIHGYGIIKDVLVMSDRRLELSTGTLFGALKRMIESGWIIRLEANNKSGRGRIEYKITRKGLSILNSEIIRLKSLVHISQELGLTGDPR